MRKWFLPLVIVIPPEKGGTLPICPFKGGLRLSFPPLRGNRNSPLYLRVR